MVNAEISVRYDFGGADGAPGTNQTIVDENNEGLGPPNLKYKLADNATIDTLNMLIKPGAGLGPYRSYWKQWCLYCVNPNGKSVSNVKFYTDGVNTLGTGVDLKIGTASIHHHSGDTANYKVATGGALTGDNMVGGHPSVAASASVFNYTSASPLAVAINEVGNVLDHAGDMTDYLVSQMDVANTCSSGVTGMPYTYFSWDEA
jgi:hypothetical protein